MKKVIIKTKEDIEKMRVAGKLAARVLEMIEPHIQQGISTGEIDRICHDYIVAKGAIPAPLNYKGFPKSTCTSINHVVCHGIPSEDKKLKSGDIINLDITVIVEGYHGDTSKMFAVGEIDASAKRLCDVTQTCLYEGIKVVRPGATLGDIGATIQNLAEQHRYSVVREFTGHGIGRSFHEAPYVLHYGRKGEGLVLEEGMCFTIEPMINQGSAAVRVLADGWTAVTKDKRLSAQYEHTLAVTSDGYEIFTLREEEKGFI